jgi:hypothetical protein
MIRIETAAPITALVYSDSARAAVIMRRLVDELSAAGAAVAGYIQHGRSRCDMVLENVATGSRLAISEDRGPGARGCRLDTDCLATAMVELQDGLANTTDLLVLNKFGKSEAEGGGFRPLIADAIERGIPVVLGVSWRNIEAWRGFAGDLSREVLLPEGAPLTTGSVLSALGISALRHLDGTRGTVLPA